MHEKSLSMGGGERLTGCNRKGEMECERKFYV